MGRDSVSIHTDVADDENADHVSRFPTRREAPTRTRSMPRPTNGERSRFSGRTLCHIRSRRARWHDTHPLAEPNASPRRQLFIIVTDAPLVTRYETARLRQRRIEIERLDD